MSKFFNAIEAWIGLGIFNQYQNTYYLNSHFLEYQHSLSASERLNSAGSWFVTHYRKRAQEVGVQAAARQLRKQGVPCEVTVAILATR